MLLVLIIIPPPKFSLYPPIYTFLEFFDPISQGDSEKITELFIKKIFSDAFILTFNPSGIYTSWSITVSGFIKRRIFFWTEKNFLKLYSFFSIRFRSLLIKFILTKNVSFNKLSVNLAL